MTYKTFVLHNTDDSQAYVLPPDGRFHVYVSPIGQLQVIDHVGNIVAQGVTGASQMVMVRPESVPLEVSGTTFESGEPVLFDDGLTSNGDCSILSISDLDHLTFLPSAVVPPAQEGRLFYSAGTGLMLCTGTTNADWIRM